ncbi:cation channel sperm-associated protein 3 isoform X1 [Callithrix jacchus]|uniref:cation channel sperm-associated protein 3 isoform X1 n=1 Tax=Callithrix jacchus TaxID=9483 RepID=UPI00159D40C1|nr:cation channel sperm-associated protein 3 isoform X1 [Callithrix jacchus]
MSQHRHQSLSKVSSSSLVTTLTEFCPTFKKFKRKDDEFQAFGKRVITSHFFKIIMICAVGSNAFLTALWTSYDIRYRLFRLLEFSEIFFVSICISELAMKVYVDPTDYWKDGYNVMDVVIIIIIFLPYTTRRFLGKQFTYLYVADGMQSLRILKIIRYSQGIRMMISAMRQTVYTVASVLLLLFLLMYIFGILGFCLFGSQDRGDYDNWGNLPVAFFTLFSLATVDGWTDLQKQLDNRGFALSRAFTIIFILLASFIFLNMFVGVMIRYTEDSIKKFEQERTLERKMTLMEEKQVILQRQQEDISRLMHMQKNADCKSFSELVENFKKTLRHTDPMVLDDFATSLAFIDIYFSTLDYQDMTIHKLQELYYEIAHVLGLVLEDLPQKKPQSLEKVAKMKDKT